MLYKILVSFLSSLFLTPVMIKLADYFKWYDEVDPRKIHKGSIPRLGGVAIFISFSVVTVYYFFTEVTDQYLSYVPIFAGGLVIWLSALLDDFINMRAKVKFLCQIVAALCVSLSEYYFHNLFGIDFPAFIGRIITFCWILGIVNAYNLIDGLDWLCSGISFLGILTLGIFIYFGEKHEATLIFALCGAIAGFLVWNRPPAKIFLGDSGSQTLGFCVAVIPLFYTGITKFEYNKLAIMVLLASIPITDVIAAVIRRTREHRSFFSADRAHIHHKLMNIGFSKVMSLTFLLLLQALICAGVLATIPMSTRIASILIVVMFTFVIVFFVTLHYINRVVNKKMIGYLSEAPQKEH